MSVATLSPESIHGSRHAKYNRIAYDRPEVSEVAAINQYMARKPSIVMHRMPRETETLGLNRRKTIKIGHDEVDMVSKNPLPSIDSRLQCPATSVSNNIQYPVAEPMEVS